MGLRGWSNERVYEGGCVQQQHMRAARPSCIAHAHEHMIDGALQPAATAPTDSLSQQAAVP